ncbi:transcriptional repressor [Clostridium sp. AM58-1XD]|uniref:Fur family transcriptional regulator n=1 Tax=Clostridium sp. AM58-1XD TaxID=2292307 RepID=UPI000E4EF6BE|nr:transcriptional repressor [Clostridium sp. AM58-1XD]RGY99310.1 transcriptional repressor [Clostridium sp. AM58-1XD]
MKNLKYSRQRESIKTCLMARRDHPTADALYMSIREEYPNISLGTVYRNLNLLVELGEIQKLCCGDGADHFDGDISPHYHFICRECGSVSDLSMDISNDMNLLAARHTDGHIDSHITYFYGTCKDCLSKRNQ